MKYELTTEDIELMTEFIREYLPMAEDMALPNYGPFMGGDPRNFSPDPECSTEEERQRHREACASWERGERRISTGFGVGATDNRAEAERCRRLRSLLDDIGQGACRPEEVRSSTK